MPVKSKPFSQFPKEYLPLFWHYVLLGERHECWPWIGSDGHAGYGQINIQGSVWHAHRIAYWAQTGDDPGDLFVCHRCDNPPCCNNNHMFLGTQTDNMRDCVNKGRLHPGIRMGEANHLTVLTEDSVRSIRQLRVEGASYVELAHKFGVTKDNIWRIIRRDTWKHI